MTKKFLKRGFPIVLFLVLLLALAWGTFYIYDVGGPSFFFSYLRVEPGDSKYRVIEILGQPDDQDTNFRLGQREGFEAEYKKADGSESEYYLFWYKGIDIVFAIGFDRNDRVTLKFYGGI